MTPDLEAYRRWALTDGRLSPRTTSKSVRYLTFLAKRGFELGDDAPSRDSFLELLAEARSEGLAPYTLNVWVTHLNRWLRSRGVTWKVPRFRHGHVPDVPAPTREQAAQLWAVEWADPATTTRNRAILALFLDVGIRRQELIDLNLTDVVVTSKGPSVVIRHGKGDEERTVAIAPQTHDLLSLYRKTYRIASDPRALFTTPNGRLSHGYVGNIVVRMGQRAGLPWITCHKLRHFTADDLLDRGVSVTTVAATLGHKKVETTMIYRTKKLNRQYAESEVRAVAGSRFRAERAEAAPAGDPGEALRRVTGANPGERSDWNSGPVGI